MSPLPTYIVAWEKPSLHNLIHTRFYLFSYDLDFLVNRDVLLEAEYFCVGEPKIADDKQKLADLKAVGKIARIGTVNVSWDSDMKPVLSDLKLSSGKIDPESAEYTDFTARISLALKNQYRTFHADEDYKTSWIWAFVELENTYGVTSKPSAYYFRKTISYLDWTFSSGWASLPDQNSIPVWKKSDIPEILRFSQHIFFKYSSERLLCRDGEEKNITFFWDGSELKILFFKILVESGWRILKTDLIEEMGFVDGNNLGTERTKEKKLIKNIHI